MYQPDSTDWRIIEHIQDGLPLVSRPYQRIAALAGVSEQEAIQRIARLRETGIIKRFGIVIHHRRLGYQANGMVVWDIADLQVGDIAHRFTDFAFVTLCYRRPRHLPAWPYNLFTMIHGHDRTTVAANVETMAQACGDFPHQILFSRRCFKQCGARYVYREPQALAASALF